VGDKLRAPVRGDMGWHTMFREYMGEEQLGEFWGVDGVMGRNGGGIVWLGSQLLPILQCVPLMSEVV